MLFVILILLLGLGLAAAGLRMVTQYQRAVVFVLGRYTGTFGPGVFWIPPIISVLRVVDIRTVALDVPSQEIITRDNVTINARAIVYFHILRPHLAVINVVNPQEATIRVAQTALRNVLGQSTLDEILSERDVLSERLLSGIDTQTEPWGIEIHSVDIKDLQMPESMQRAMAIQAQAEREKRAKIIGAEGELLASQQLAQAARIMTASPGALQLRYLQTLVEIGAEKNTTIVFPLPIDIITPFLPQTSPLISQMPAVIPDLSVAKRKHEDL